MSIRLAAAFLLASFAALVAFGITGSSFDLTVRHSPALIAADSQVLAGSTRLVRSDEWAVFTPMAIAQANHRPPFPVVNQNLGADGHNMLVIGMVGVPVAHVSALAKPATWGFYAFDLRRALAWAWWMPVFGCLFALWGVMSLLLPGRPLVGLAVSLVFLSSSYVAAWSNWPAYAVFFPAAGLWLAHRIMFTSRCWVGVGCAALLGLCLAGFVLILYPPWQVSLGYLFLVLAAGLVWRDRLWSRFNVMRGLAYGCALLLAGAIVYAWWQDAAPAIRALQATIYPGQRVASSGGGIPLWQFVEGFLNHYTLYFDGAPSTNASESSSFFYFFPVAIAALWIGALRKQRIGPLEGLLSAFCVWVLWYQLVGMPPALAELTLWGRVPDYRADLSLGLASIVLCALVLVRARPQGNSAPAVSVLPALVWAAFVAAAAAMTPSPASGAWPKYLLPWVFFITFVVSWLLWARRVKSFFAALLLLTCSASLPFNPVALAPHSVQAQGAAGKAGDVEQGRVLVLGGQIQAMALLSAGVPVANGVFYYPPRMLWQSLDPSGEHASLVNRFQHLIFEPEAQPGPASYRVESPQDDVVIVKFDPERFDFALTKAGRVVAPDSYDLSANASLVAIQDQGPFRVYRVRGVTPSPQ